METIRISMLQSSVDCCRRAASGQFQKLIGDDAGYALTQERTGVYTAMGTGAHAGVQNMRIHKILHGSLNNVQENIDMAIWEYDKSLQETPDVLYDNITGNQDIGRLQIEQFVKHYQNDVAPFLKFPENADPAKHIERHIVLQLKGYKVSGHIDVTPTRSICDTKTGKALRACHTQLGGYANLAVSDGDEKPEQLIVHHLPRVSVGKPYPGTTTLSYPVDFCMNEAWYIINQLIRDVENFKASGNPACFQANPNSMLCNEKYCRAYGTKFCEYH